MLRKQLIKLKEDLPKIVLANLHPFNLDMLTS